MVEVRSKSGNGEFHLTVGDDGSVLASIEVTGEAPRRFDTVRAAYDYFRPLAADASCWNIAYHLEDFLPDERDAPRAVSHERH